MVTVKLTKKHREKYGFILLLDNNLLLKKTFSVATV